ncbi:MAG: DUF6492 family protein [Steroidobacteraceae bacterium]
MKPHSYALVTPTFSLDFERCRLLVESVERWVAPHVRQYLVIDRRDLALFRTIANPRTEILIVEDIVPRWIFRIPGMRRFWFSLRTLPLRNWILQQMVKLSIPGVVREDVLLYSDSDVFFVAPYDPHSFEREGKVPLFVETGQRGLIKSNDEWHRVAAELLGIAPEPSYDTNFIGNVIPWWRTTAVEMQQRIAAVACKPWQLAIARRHVFSEYIIYGMFSQHLAGPNGRQWNDGVLRTLNYWLTVPLDTAGLEGLRAQLRPEHHSVMISAKSRTPVEQIRRVFF